MAKEPALAPESTSVAGERGVPADQAVAGNDDRYRVLAIGSPYRARRRRVPEGSGENPVAPGTARSDAAQSLPDSALERRPAGVDRDTVERREVSGQVGADPCAEAERVPRPDRPRPAVPCGQHAGQAGSSELERAEAAVSGRDHDAADRTLDLVDEQGTARLRAHVIFDPGWWQT